MKLKKARKVNFNFRKFPDERDAWLLSYADIITMLLCFFVLFFSTDKKKTTGQFSEMMAFIQKELGIKHDEKIENIQKVTSMIKNRYGDDKVVNALKELNMGDGVEVLNYKHYVSIEFPKGNLFERGVDKLAQASVREIVPIIQKLKAHKKKFNINIVAYTDPTAVNPITKKTTRWWTNNRELSAQRALNVQNLFLENGFTQDSVFITGRGVKAQKIPEKDQPLDLEGKVIDTKNYNAARTISIRLEAKDNL